MTSVLIVDDDAHLCRALIRALNAHGFVSTAAPGYHQALELLGKHRFDVLLTDLRMGEKDGIDLLRALREVEVGPRPILMSAHATALEGQRALELGAVRVLCKPFETRDVVEAIERAVDSSSGYVGQVHGLSLIDMLQMFHYARRSLTIDVLGKSPATISMSAGEVVDARCGEEAGEEALRSILCLPAGSLRTRSAQPISRTIDREFQSLLLDLIRELDERGRSAPPAAAVNGHAPRSRAGWSHPERARADAACQAIVARVDRAIACELVDLRSGVVIGAHQPPGVEDVTTRRVRDWVVQLFRRSLRQTGAGAASPEPFEEFQLTSQHSFRFAKTLCGGRVLVSLVTARGANVGLGWSQLRAAISAADGLFDGGQEQGGDEPSA